MRATEIGSEVIGHSWDHRDLTRLSVQQITNQINDTSNLIEEVTGISPQLFRPPYGATNQRVVDVARSLGYGIVRWSIDPQDWRYRDAEHVYNFIMDRVVDGSIILLHDIRPTTAEAMTYLIPSLISAGYQLVTVSELIEHVYGGI